MPTNTGCSTAWSAEQMGAGPPAIHRVDVLGVNVSAIDMAVAVEAIENWVATRDPQYICVTGVHGVMESQRDESLRDIHNRAGLVTPDGMPLVWITQLRGWRNVRRVYGPELMLACCRRAQTTGWRHFFLGGGPGVPELLAEKLVRQFPGLQVAGTYSPPFDEEATAVSDHLVQRINDTRPDIVWVGLGTPKQERWMASNVHRLSPCVLIGVGAAFDFHAGLKPMAPGWMQRSGLEWLFRLGCEPRRLWRRYLINNPAFILKVLQQAIRPPADAHVGP